MFNDPAMRASLPALFVLWVFIGRTMADLLDAAKARSTGIKSLALPCLVMIGAFVGRETAKPTLRYYAIHTPEY
jgi:hypothetical protein